MRFKKVNWTDVMVALPLLSVLSYFLFQSLSFPLHDFSNSYFAGSLANDPDLVKTLFDIHSFNTYAWDLGYPEVLIDFYVNSPFTVSAFSPLSAIKDAYIAKLIFNILSILLFLIAVYLLFKLKGNYKKAYWFLLMIPFIFFIPLRNQILFGQTYFLVLSFIIFSFYLIEKKKKIAGVSLLGVAVLLKIFPVFYGMVLIFKKQWKTIGIGIVASLFVISISILHTGTELWTTYLFDVIPNVIANNSSVNFQYNAQSVDVFLKTTFLYDPYYNPNAFINNENLYYIFKWLFKSLVIAVAIRCSYFSRKETLKLLSIWVVALFLLQSRTATYAQILWIIPAFYIYTCKISLFRKVSFFIVVFAVCNIPVIWLKDLPLFFKFSRLWLSIIAAIIFFSAFNKQFNLKTILVVLVIMIPFNLKGLFSNKQDIAEYVLKEKKHFMVFDFKIDNGKLSYDVMGRNGKETFETEIEYTMHNAERCKIIDNQIFIDGKQVTYNAALKKKPVLINNCEVYYLSDYNSRRGAYTLRKISTCKKEGY